MRILHIINGEFYSGAERIQDLLVQRLPDHGYEPFIACLKPKFFNANCDCSNDLIYDFPMETKTDFRPIFKLLKFIIKKKILLLHTHTPRSAFAGKIVSTFINIPRVHHVHSPTINDTENYLRNITNTFVERFSVTGTERIITVSESIAHWLHSLKIANERVTVIPNGVPSFSLMKKGKIDKKIIIGTVALFRPRKGLEIFLVSLKQLIQKNIDYSFLAIGNFESEKYEFKIKSMAKQLKIEKNIVWRGFHQDVGSELNKMDIFVLPSFMARGCHLLFLRQWQPVFRLLLVMSKELLK